MHAVRPSFMQLFGNSFIPSVARSFIHSFTSALTHSCTRTFIDSKGQILAKLGTTTVSHIQCVLGT